MEILQITWFIIIGIMLTVYSVLDGFDLGIAILTPFFAKDDRETQQLYTTIGPIWDGNEVFIIAGGALLFAAFPQVYATVFSGFYLAFMLLLFALIFRAVSLEFWSLHTSSRNVWKITFMISSILISILYGVALGNVIVGIPIDSAMHFTGSFFTLFRPFPLVIGILGLCAILLQGSAFASLKTTGSVQEEARKISLKLIYIYLLMILICVIFAIISKSNTSSIAPWLLTVLCIASLAACRKFLIIQKYKLAFTCSSLTFIALWGIAGSALFPNLVNALNKQYSLSIYNSSSSKLTLTVMLIIVAIGLPLVALYMRILYKIFKGQVKKA